MAEDLFFFFFFFSSIFFLLVDFFPRGGCRIYQTGGGRRSKHWPPGAGDPRDATAWRACFCRRPPPPLGRRSPCWGPGVYLILLLGAVVVVWWLACLTVDRQIGGSNLPHVGQHFVCPAVCMCWLWLHVKDPVPLIEKSRAWCPGGRFPSSFIHEVITSPIWIGYMIVCSRPEDGLRCWQGVKPPLKLKLVIIIITIIIDLSCCWGVKAILKPNYTVFKSLYGCYIFTSVFIHTPMMSYSLWYIPTYRWNSVHTHQTSLFFQ